MVRIIGFYITL